MKLEELVKIVDYSTKTNTYPLILKEHPSDIMTLEHIRNKTEAGYFIKDSIIIYFSTLKAKYYAKIIDPIFVHFGVNGYLSEQMDDEPICKFKTLNNGMENTEVIGGLRVENNPKIKFNYEYELILAKIRELNEKDWGIPSHLRNLGHLKGALLLHNKTGEWDHEAIKKGMIGYLQLPTETVSALTEIIRNYGYINIKRLIESGNENYLTILAERLIESEKKEGLQTILDNMEAFNLFLKKDDALTVKRYILESEDHNEIKKFFNHIPYYLDIDDLKNDIIKLKNKAKHWHALEFAKYLSKLPQDYILDMENIRTMEKLVLKSKRSTAYLDFIENVPQANLQKFEEAVIKNGSQKTALAFAIKYKNRIVDIKPLEDKILQGNNPKNIVEYAIKLGDKADKKAIARKLLDMDNINAIWLFVEKILGYDVDRKDAQKKLEGYLE